MMVHPDFHSIEIHGRTPTRRTTQQYSMNCGGGGLLVYGSKIVAFQWYRQGA